MKSSMTVIQSNGWTEIDLILKQKWRRFIWRQVSFKDRSALWLSLFLCNTVLWIENQHRDCDICLLELSICTEYLLYHLMILVIQNQTKFHLHQAGVALDVSSNIDTTYFVCSRLYITHSFKKFFQAVPETKLIQGNYDMSTYVHCIILRNLSWQLQFIIR